MPKPFKTLQRVLHIIFHNDIQDFYCSQFFSNIWSITCFGNAAVVSCIHNFFKLVQPVFLHKSCWKSLILILINIK